MNDETKEALIKLIPDESIRQEVLRLVEADIERMRQEQRDRVLAGLQRARENGVKLGRPRWVPSHDNMIILQSVLDNKMPLTCAAKSIGVSRSTIRNWIQQQPN